MHFELEGKGEIIGFANGKPISLVPLKGTERRAFNGMCLLVVQSTQKKGAILVRASSIGLPQSMIQLNVK